MPRRIRHKRGFTLIEVAAAVLVSTVLLGLAGTLLAAMLRVEKTFAPATGEQLELVRLGEHFRRDAHAAVELQILGEGGAWTFTFSDGGQAEYRAAEDTVIRVERGAAEDQDAAKQQEHTLPDASQATITQASVAGKPFAQLSIVNRKDGKNGRTFYRIDAELRSEGVVNRT